MGESGSLHDEASQKVVEVQFTPKAGIAGWLQALARRQPLYGAGWTESAGTGLRLYGWRRTWLGMGEQAEITIPHAKIRNAVVDGVTLTFEIVGPLRRTCVLELPSPAAADAVAQTLPQTKTRLFERHWRELQEFNRLSVETARHTWSTYLLMLLCVGMFVVQVKTAGQTAWFDINQSIRLGALSFQQVRGGEVWRLVSSAFLHGDPLHLIVNMWVLYNIGRLTERLLGSLPHLIAYLSCAAIASVGSLLWAPNMVSIGASGAIFGLFGIFLAHLLVRRTVIPAILLRAHWLSTLLFVLVSLTNGFLQGGINDSAHLAGLLGGLALGSALAWPRLTAGTHSQWRRATATVAACAVLLCAEWLAGSALWKPADDWVSFKRSYDWVVSGEADNFKQWGALEQKIALRKVSTQEAASAYRTDIAPFWRDAEKKLDQMAERANGDFQTTLRSIASYAQSRLDLAEADAALMDSPIDTQLSRKAQEAALAMNHASAHMNVTTARGDYTYRPRGLSEFPLVLRLTRLVPGGEGCIRPRESERFEGKYGASSDAPAREVSISCQAQHDFLCADFAALESGLANYDTTLADLADGTSSLDWVPSGLSDLFDMRPTDFNRHMALLADWRRQFPDSVWPDLIEARLMADTGWNFRGHGFAQDVAAQNQQMFHYYLTAASEILRADMTRAAARRYWYELDVGVQNDLAEDRDAMKEAYGEGAALFPLDQRLHAQMLRTLMPRWGGSAEEIDDMISKAYAKTVNKAGIQVYARLYWLYADLEGESVDIFTQSAADWQLMRNGFRDMLQKHPDSNFVLNGYARFACVAEDVEEYRKIRPRLDGHFSPTAWPPGLSAAICDKRIEDLAAR